jgi:hypothetical protein
VIFEKCLQKKSVNLGCVSPSSKERRNVRKSLIVKETYSQGTLISSFNRSKSLSLLEHREQWDLNKTRVNEHIDEVNASWCVLSEHLPLVRWQVDYQCQLCKRKVRRIVTVPSICQIWDLFSGSGRTTLPKIR